MFNLTNYYPLFNEGFYGWVSKEIPPSDIRMLETVTIIRIDLPGMDKKDIHVNVNDDQLIVSGERIAPDGECDQTDCIYGEFKLVWTLKYFDKENITSSYKNGVLEIKINRKKDQKEINIV